MQSKLIFSAALALSLTGCGTMPQERAVSGAGIGAGAGAILGAVTGLSVVQGAVLGAAAGGLTGALTDKSQVNLGDPAWKKDGNNAAVAPHQNQPVAMNQNQAVATIQAGLNKLGYNAGVVDGRIGPRTQDAVRAYQRDHGLLVDGQLSPQLAQHIASAGG